MENLPYLGLIGYSAFSAWLRSHLLLAQRENFITKFSAWSQQTTNLNKSQQTNNSQHNQQSFAFCKAQQNNKSQQTKKLKQIHNKSQQTNATNLNLV